jgi:hypothetical protein
MKIKIKVMKKVIVIVSMLLTCGNAYSQYDINSYIHPEYYGGEINLFPTETTYKLKTDCSTKNGEGKFHFMNDTCGWGALNNMYSYTLLPTAKNLELIFKEAKLIVDFYQKEPYCECDFYQPSINSYNNEEVARIIDGGTEMAYLNLNKTINYAHLAEIGKNKEIYFTIEWELSPNRLFLRVFMNDHGFAGLALFDANGFKAY